MNQIAVDIGRHVAGLVEDGSTIRVGVGSISTAALYALEGKKDLGVHTDMLTDAYLHLVKKGVITNARKTLHPGKIIASFCLGSRELYDFVDNNPMVALYPIDYTNNYLVISENDRMVTINSGLEVDLSGQVCSDSLGYEIYSGVGGAIDFLRGARGSRGGKAIMVLPSTTMDGSKSRIVPALTEGAGVVTTRGGVQYVVTEYGVASLQGKSLRERALSLISIAHPDFRDELMEAAHQIHYLEKDTRRYGDKPGHLSARLGIFSDIHRSWAAYSSGRQESTDERAVKEFFYSLPKDEAYFRFLSHMKVFPYYDVKAMVNIDYHREMCILGFAGEMGSERIISLAYYHLDDETMTAEVDFAVHPDYARGGIATSMVRHIVEKGKAKRHKDNRFIHIPGNERVFGVFHKLDYVVESSLSAGVYEIRVRLDQPAQKNAKVKSARGDSKRKSKRWKWTGWSFSKDKSPNWGKESTPLSATSNIFPRRQNTRSKNSSGSIGFPVISHGGQAQLIFPPDISSSSLACFYRHDEALLVQALHAGPYPNSRRRRPRRAHPLLLPEDR